MSTLSLQGIKKRFGAHQTIHGVDLEVEAGEFVVFVGPSGCGKSTLLRMIAGLEDVSEGSIRIGGMDVTRSAPSARDVAMVFQSYALYPHMTVRQNLSFGMRMRKVDRAVIAAKLERAAAILQLQPYMERKPAELSGGQCQRVAIGRALVQEPSVFLFDEPLSNLDAELRLRMRIEISALHRELGKTMVYVTHDQVEAMTLADKMVVLRAGRIEQVGHPLDLYANPCNEFVAGFVGAPAMNMLAGQYRAEGANAAITLDGGALLDCALAAQGAAAGGACKAGVRPEHWQIGGDGLLLATVTVVERLGASSYIHAVCGQHTLCVETRAAHAPLAGDSISLTPLPGMVYLFDDAGRTISAPKAAGTR
ncbi:ABC transporter ATP-binding protein [Pseudoduganella aquatica]|uniref:sn-glycerol-3-phosphate ABC transporter ATP-binding protein UgpC n=1 Tax=Pseudoduganella aquatica TaxID=2660641 RepID=A0A7X4H8R1_9BURK|nr:sn-glycerol-3-phosphate ABC transporter ATP-binding protein UgpC [Pseudoduganella aquatica]MYN06741.1 sn-glycerol-3-phosphate ABC transporter ATP-binding protein UgpC [Pseudoduganella aquatica]